MRPPRLTRPAPPKKLVDDGPEWTRQLDADYQTWQRAPSVPKKPPLPKPNANRYGHEEIRKAIVDIYGGLCCYCESKVGVTSAIHVEHYRPKGKEQYLLLSYEWDNLHLVCQECNLTKSAKFDEHCRPVIPTEDEPLDHLEYYVHQVYGISERGIWTVREIGLARIELTEERFKYLKRYVDLVGEARRAVQELVSNGYVDRTSPHRIVVEKAIAEMETALGPGAQWPSMLRSNNLDQVIARIKTDYQTLPMR
jgi:5-methylcytosine-specific restriction endonuclease McrA